MSEISDKEDKKINESMIIKIIALVRVINRQVEKKYRFGLYETQHLVFSRH